MNTEDHLTSAMTLIRTCKTMVLGTCREDCPWTAPVYYVYVRPDFFFFSSPRSRHVQEARDDAEVAAAIFSDHDRWEEIQGVQMSGRVEAVRRRSVQLSVTARYLAKFPFARDFLTGAAKQIPDLRDKVNLYTFSPLEIHYVCNRTGFGQRVLIQPLTTEQKEF